MAISARCLDGGRLGGALYRIGDEEYGYDLCRVELFLPLREQLTGKECHELADEIATLVVKKIEAAKAVSGGG